MTSQNDDTGSKPRVIDLDAEDIRSESEASASASEETREEAAEAFTPPPGRTRGFRRGIAIALVLGLIGGGFLYGGVLSSYLPSNQMVALKNQVAALAQNNTDLANQIAAVKQRADGAAEAAAAANDAAAKAADVAKSAAAQIAGVGSKADAGAQQAATLGEQIAALKSGLDGLRKSMSSAPAASGGAASPADAAVLAALGQRIDALEKDVASLKAGAGPSAQAGTTAALSQALSDLKAKVAAGTSFQPEYERIARMVPAASGLDEVAASAAEGLPDAKGLASELTAAIPSLPQAEAPAAEDNSYFGSLMKSLSGIISIRPIGNTDWRMLAEKAAAFAEAGDLTQAISVIDAGEGEKPMALSQWRGRAAARLKLEAAVSQVSEAVLRQIAASGGAAQ
ncbi:MAG: hypothetical protein IOC82_08970 [Aestuariivirga sp.]|uniref:COG4223 family protein n=1 Tax=Aestuariivirga sp. TaxID=2650926 RepID=UPI0025C0CEE3|nr:hypothetical protein [Aestuariivirga sp.]MCA3561141.1 hypothetical protein [Aestuariivirga sp.]